MLNIVLFEPEIPPNTGNIIRLCANMGFALHLIEPLGFSLDDKRVRRAGLDYSEMTSVRRYPNWGTFIAEHGNGRLFAISTKGTHNYSEQKFEKGDFLVMGPETRGLPADIRTSAEINGVLRIPMLPNSRSMNLSNATAVIAFEAWRQLSFEGAI
ncbi:MAG: tRNA (uridine(34)/cytosine(34)/5-carboxymethylaminomethyluridine(34)-2'-O)-methyltransferase TrmL [Marinagarivorans sp.]|nr:tRNA (uridine(34)/cytosine(34)/5-carboxymethylaminomethyluridine(34)-2'-O)-methyltransferase TrmL [Marinagarivorans sp.]